MRDELGDNEFSVAIWSPMESFCSGGHDQELQQKLQKQVKMTKYAKADMFDMQAPVRSDYRSVATPFDGRLHLGKRMSKAQARFHFATAAESVFNAVHQ